MASETATQQSSRPECQYPNCYTNSRGIPLRTRYPVDIMGGCTRVVQAEQCKEVTINKMMIVHDQHQEWGGHSSWWVLIISRWEKINGPIDHEYKPMQMVQVAQGAVNCNVAWPIVCQGYQYKKIILPNVKREVEDATPG
jgi:hypothetical protein